ncbi:MAG: metal ABC transporter solute-binding protein, Zn/Mn family [Egibacteraceae bacterium]
MWRSRVFLSGVALLGALIAGCGGSGAGTGAAGEPLRVVASFYPLAVAAEQVGGDRVEVANLTPAGTEPHDLELDPRQTEELLTASVAVVMGRGFQPAVEQTAEQRQGVTVEVLRVLPISQEGEVAPEEEEGDPEGAAEPTGLDPHVWLDPLLMADVVDQVAAALGQAAPAEADGFRERAQAYRAELEALHGEYERGLATCERREIVTAHDAFGWLAARYDLRQMGIAGISPEAEPDPRRLAELADLVRREGVTTIFTETLVSPAIADTLARETGVRTAVLNPLEGLADEEIAQGATYLSVMRDNLAVLREALGCA